MIAARPHAIDDARRWTKLLAPYREPSLARSLAELAVTAMPFAALWLLMWLSLHHAGYGLTLFLAVPTAGFLVRLFMIQHDCGHGSFFRRRWANDWLGRAIGVLTLTAYDHWRRRHAVHHATGGNLDQRGIGDVHTLTVREFQRLSAWPRLVYRLTRHPLVVLGIGPVYVFVLKHRLPSALRTAGRDAWTSILATNLAIASLATAAAALVGWRDVLLVQAPVTWLASSLGVWLFYVQHQFAGTSWERDQDWAFHAGALAGSSHLDLPPVLRWFTADIGVHHVHHLSARIPSYRLGEVLRDHPELRGVNRLTAWDSLRGMRLALWDEDARRLVSFREARPAGPT
jgi:omega-6 fatty acid desaturase (delta-12 desaturase)